MGLFDKVTQKAAGLAGDAATAGKVGAAQVKLKSLEGDADTAKRDLGAQAYALIKAGELSHPSLDGATAAVDAAMAAIAAKTAEIEAIKAGGADTAAAPAGAVPPANAVPPASAVPPPSAVPPVPSTDTVPATPAAAPYVSPPATDQPSVQPYTTPSDPAGPAS
jgi:hypothetical protein